LSHSHDPEDNDLYIFLCEAEFKDESNKEYTDTYWIHGIDILEWNKIWDDQSEGQNIN
jgi:hypothetical protein